MYIEFSVESAKNVILCTFQIKVKVCYCGIAAIPRFVYRKNLISAKRFVDMVMVIKGNISKK